MSADELAVQMKIAQSEGGEYDDDALVAGYVLGALDTYLTYIESAFDFVVPETCVEQADLFAMRHEFVSRVIHRDSERGWTVMHFEPSEQFVEGTRA